MMVVDVIEAALDVAFDDPLIRWARPTLYGLLAGWADRVADMLQSVTTRFLLWTTRSRTVGIPSGRNMPGLPRFGIITRRTGVGR
jgi:hypothetical protein